MSYPNGAVPATMLMMVGPGTNLLTSVAHAYLNLQTVARLENHIAITPAGHYGSGYRSLGVQRVFYNAAHGNTADAAKAGLDPHSTISIAYPGYSSHGTGTRIDMLFNGHSPDSTDLSIAKRYGFTREFGAADENHFMHDGRTAISGPIESDQIRIMAKFLNDKHLGKTTQAEHIGKRDPEFIWLIQHYGHMMKWYPAACVEDGVTGHFTEIAYTTLWNHLKAS